jgi:hypothetical protein
MSIGIIKGIVTILVETLLGLQFAIWEKSIQVSRLRSI